MWCILIFLAFQADFRTIYKQMGGNPLDFPASLVLLTDH